MDFVYGFEKVGHLISITLKSLFGMFIIKSHHVRFYLFNLSRIGQQKIGEIVMCRPILQGSRILLDGFDGNLNVKVFPMDSSRELKYLRAVLRLKTAFWGR